MALYNTHLQALAYADKPRSISTLVGFSASRPSSSLESTRSGSTEELLGLSTHIHLHVHSRHITEHRKRQGSTTQKKKESTNPSINRWSQNVPRYHFQDTTAAVHKSTHASSTLASTQTSLSVIKHNIAHYHTDREKRQSTDCSSMVMWFVCSLSDLMLAATSSP